MEFGKFAPEKMKAIMYKYGEGYPCGTLPISLQNDCQTCITIPERYAKSGAGRYYIQIMDGCEECDKIELELVAECYINSVTVTEALPRPEHCNECR